MTPTVTGFRRAARGTGVGVGEPRPDDRTPAPRLAGPADLAPYLRLRDAAARWMLARGIDQWRPGEWDRPAAAALDAQELWVVDDVAGAPGTLVAGMRLQWADPDVWPDRDDRAAGYVHGIVVDRRHAGQGLGQLLLEHARREVLRVGRTAVRLDCRAANPVLRARYRAFGFTEIDVRSVRFAGHPEFDSDLARFEAAATVTLRRPAAARIGVPAGHRRGQAPQLVAGVTRVAAIDCGTNSIRLLVVDLDDHGAPVAELDRRMRIVRLGEGVDRSGRLAPAALTRTFDACEEFGSVFADLRPDRVRFVATSASRDASNAAEFVAGVRDRLGVTPEVISGAEEAQLSFAGAVAGLPPGIAAPRPRAGHRRGSTEFVVGPPSGGVSTPVALERHNHEQLAPGRIRRCEAEVPGSSDAGDVRGLSTDIGCVRLTERHLHDDPPTPAQMAAATADVDGAIEAAAAAVPMGAVRSVVGVAGSVTTIAAMVLELPRYESRRIHLARLPVSKVVRACDDLLGMTRERRARLPFMHPGRADVIGAGALILSRVLTAIRPQLDTQEITVSEHDILDGIAASAR